MSEYIFEVALFVGKEELSTSKAPSLEQARSVAKWHCDKGSINFATIRNLQTRALESYRPDGEDVVELGTGTILDACPGCQEKDIVIDELQRQIKVEKLKNAKLRKEKEGDIRDSAYYEIVMECFDFWKRVCRHPRSELDLPRYKNILPFLRGVNGEDLEGESLQERKMFCMMAIAGAAHKPNNMNSKGDPYVYNSWELIFRNRTKFEGFCNRCPKKWKEIYGVNI